MPKVMIVDDDRTTNNLMKMILELEGFEVLVAPSGEEALKTLDSVQPDAFLVDFNLPDMEGTALVQQLRENGTYSHTPVIVASGMERKEEALAAGADQFLFKPFEPEDLMTALKRMLG